MEIKSVLIILFIFLECSTAKLIGQNSNISLPKPTGRYTVGTQSVDWTDDSRKCSFPPNVNLSRQILLQIWYPASQSGDLPVASYNPSNPKYQNITTHSVLNAKPIRSDKKFPVIFVIPGRGTSRMAYTILAEDLASRGYFVLSIDMPEIGYVKYENGHEIVPSDSYNPGVLMRGPYEKVDSFFQTPVKIGLQDLEFVFRKIQSSIRGHEENNIWNKLDLKNVGILSHSLGGRIGGAWADKNMNIKAYLSMEGIPPREIRYNGLNVAQCHLVTSGTYPYAKENYSSITDNHISDTYLIILDKYGHNSITDYPILNPGGYGYEIDPQEALTTIVEICLSFFDQYLRDGKMKLANYEKENVRINFYSG